MEKSPISSKYPLRRVRLALILVAIISFPFNLSPVLVGWDRAAALNQLIPVTFSGLSAIFLLLHHRKRGYSKYLAPEMGLDAFLGVYLLVAYIIILATSWRMRENIVCVYGNLACLVSSLLHGHAFLKAARHKYLAHFIRKFQCGSFVVCPRCNTTSTGDYEYADVEQENGIVSRERDDNENARNIMLVDEEDAVSTDGLLGRQSEECSV